MAGGDELPIRRVSIVPHTHWDREWYEPFPVFRVRLVTLVDELLALLERDPGYRRYLLDGQTTVIDDYLSVRPEARERVEALVRAGRLALGPWAVLMDEYMVSGETIVRDLQRGLARAVELGGAMRVGYLPDMFGHVAQMPQLLRLAGINHAVVWRGVPAIIEHTAFWWTALDGSTVRAEYLYGSYSNGRELPGDTDGLVRRARAYEEELGDALSSDGALLLMNGSDHLPPQPHLAAAVAAANEAEIPYRFEITSLAEHLSREPVLGLPTWTGELRSGARANVLMGVASNRVDVHRECAAAERAVERYAEPLSAMLLPAAHYPHRLLDDAWDRLVLNAAHDSSCACSADDVVDAVNVRYREARAGAMALAHAAVDALAAEVPGGGGAGRDEPVAAYVVVNAVTRERGGVVQVSVSGHDVVHLTTDDGQPCATQVVDQPESDAFSAAVTGTKVRWVVELVRGEEFAGTRVAAWEARETGPSSYDIDCRGAAPGELGVDLETLRGELSRLGTQGTSMRIRVRRSPISTVVVAVPAVPAGGWCTLTVAPGPGPATDLDAGDTWIANGRVRVEVDPHDGSLGVRTAEGLEQRGLLRLVDGGDGGDTYNYSPPADDLLVDEPQDVTVQVLEAGPVRARLLVSRTYHWPAYALGDERACRARSTEIVATTVHTMVELRADDPLVRVSLELDNSARDHRLRVHLPLPGSVEGSDAECPFGVVHRGLTAEGGPAEAGLPTNVSRRFVDASDGATGLTVFHDGLLEYEVVDDGRELALTVLRCVGYLSRMEPSLRPNPAGPPLPVRGAQMPGPQRAELALMLHRGPWTAAQPYDAADNFSVPLLAARVPSHARGTLASRGERLSVRGAVVSAIARDGDGRLIVRVFEPAGARTEVDLRWDGEPLAVEMIDLTGRSLGRVDGPLSLRPQGIATLRVTDPR